jgi:uncharacterized protein YdeI (YjbR/CyaY-like superfamily)
MNITKTLYVTSKDQLREWFKKNHDKEKEIWLIYYKKSSGKTRIPYTDCVDEALCFGWIDSTAKSINEEKYAQRFTPRRKKSNLSEANKERIRRLIANGRMTQFGINAIEHLFDLHKDKKDKLKISKDILAKIKENKNAWEHFQNFDDGYKKVRIGYMKMKETKTRTI